LERGCDFSVDPRPWLDALPNRAGKITREQQMKLKELQEKSGREVTKVIKKESKKQVTFVCNTI